MIRILVPALLILTVCYACSKDKYRTKPSLEVVDQTSIVAPDNEATFYIKLKFTDKEGDLSGVRDSSVFYQAQLLNVRTVVGGPNYPAVYESMPEFPEKKSGEIELRMIRFNYYKEINTNQGGNDKNDTLIFRIAVKDKGGNVSDTVTSAPIILLGQ